MALAQAILTCLIDAPHSGYDLSKIFSESVGYFWNASQQQIYRELGKLESRGLIEAEIIPREGRLDKKIYSITDAGKQHLIGWMLQPSEPDIVREDLLVKIFAGGLVPVDVLVDDVERHRRIHVEKLAKYREIEQEKCPYADRLSSTEKLRRLVLHAGIRYESEWIAWCDEALATLKESEEQS
ncbi:transcriptional regulator, PadR family [Richelia sinica FACHB-800]|uniref:Transcriptional regulator, PadR family n=1 Tax=Richelia sinica FACHB-800 TaxID=1357546 RepID=A0A975Y7F9_9NOST|nr:PadR family transcriptional regulator [Richelia sinica]MBD2663977.1 PadR family transcriptional regulator [Richelia sinica FACHB-800]QXE26293.1 transcriptional regulator, PadR family [Richelia sinica FACHB-800]